MAGAKADPTVINAITKLESGVGSIGRTDLSLLSTGNATTIIRFIAITSEAKIKGMELTINSIAETVSTSLLTTRGLAITPESIVKWVYFDWPNAVTVEAVKQQAEAWMESLQEGLASDPPEWVQTIADDIALATAFWR